MQLKGGLKMPFDPTKQVRTRDGRPARILCTDRRRGIGDYPILALVRESVSALDESLYNYSSCGYLHIGRENSLDLINYTPELTWEQRCKGAVYHGIQVREQRISATAKYGPNEKFYAYIRGEYGSSNSSSGPTIEAAIDALLLKIGVGEFNG